MKDWDLAEDYYEEESGKRDLKLEDFIESGGSDSGIHHSGDEALEKTADDVRRVMALTGQGKSTEKIAEELLYSEDYIYRIQVCAQAFHEDDEIAVAHLVLMS